MIAVHPPDIGHWERADIDLAVVKPHGHDFTFVPDPAQTGPGLVAVISIDFALRPGADIQLALKSDRRIGLSRGFGAAAVGPFGAAFVAKNRAAVDEGIEPIPIDGETHQPHVWTYRRPGGAAIIDKGALAIEAGGVEPTLINRERGGVVGFARVVPRGGCFFGCGVFDAWMPAEGPLAVGIDPIDLAAGRGVQGIAHGRSAGIIPAEGAVERALKFDDGVDGVASDWIAQIGPAFFPFVAPQVTDLFFAILKGAGVQVSTQC